VAGSVKTLFMLKIYVDNRQYFCMEMYVACDVRLSMSIKSSLFDYLWMQVNDVILFTHMANTNLI